MPHYLESMLEQAASSAPFLLGQTVDDGNEDEIISEPSCTGDGCDPFETEENVRGTYEYCENTYDPDYCPDQSYYE